MKLIKQTDIAPIMVRPGDRINLSYADNQGQEHPVLSHPIEEADTFNAVAIFEVKNELGFESGFAGVFGKKEQK